MVLLVCSGRDFLSVGKWSWCFNFSFRRLNPNSSKAPNKLIIRRFDLSNDETFVNVTSSFRELPNDSYSFGFRAEMFKDLPAFLVQIGVALPSAKGKFDNPFKSFADICKYYKNNNGNMFLKLFFNGHFDDKKFPTKCPVQAGTYFMEGFRLNDDFLSMAFINTRFKATVDICTKVEGKLKCFAKATIHGEIADRQQWETEMSAKNKSSGRV